MAKCAKCGKQFSLLETADSSALCDDCQAAAKQLEAAESARAASRAPQIKYPALRAIVLLYRILASICGFGTIVAAFLQESSLHAVGAILIGAGATISCVVTAEVIRVLLDMEENTRNCYSALWEILQKQK